MKKINVNDLKNELICRMTLEDLLGNLAENFDELEKYFDFYGNGRVSIIDELWHDLMFSQEDTYELDEDDFHLFKKSLSSNCNFEDIEHLSSEELKELALRVCSRASAEKFANDLDEKMINALKSQIVDVTENSFNSIVSILNDEIEENGINMNDVPLFKLVEEENGTYSLYGSKIVLACIQLELLKGFGMWYYDTLDDFIECNMTLDEAVKGHLCYLKEFNNIYGYDEYFQYEIDVDYLESTTYGWLDEDDMIRAVENMDAFDLYMIK